MWRLGKRENGKGGIEIGRAAGLLEERGLGRPREDKKGDTTLLVTPKFTITVLVGRETLHFNITIWVVLNYIYTVGYLEIADSSSDCSVLVQYCTVVHKLSRDGKEPPDPKRMQPSYGVNHGDVYDGQ